VSTLARVVLAALGAVAAAIVVLNLALQVDAWRAHRREGEACPFDDEEPLPPPARAFAAVRLFVTECAACMLLVAAAPFALRRRRPRPSRDARRPVVLVAGRAQRGAGLGRLATRLRRDGWTHVEAVGCGGVDADLERCARRLADAVEAVRRAAGAERVDVVAHGLGGLVTRVLLATAAGRASVARVVTLGAPHQGTEAPRCVGGPRTRALRPGSPLLVRLAADAARPAGVDCTAIYSTDDAVVLPAGNGYWAGAFNIVVRGVGHATLLFSRRVYALLHENLAAEAEPARGAAPG
jgi:triacylglycerol lipase